jgi:hypothetical protein
MSAPANAHAASQESLVVLAEVYRYLREIGRDRLVTQAERDAEQAPTDFADLPIESRR